MKELEMALKCTLNIVIPVCVFAILFSIIEKINSKSIYKSFGFKGLVITGIIGTMVHEFSHMLMCVIFRHRITDFSLFRPIKSSYDGIMGYVNHSYNKKSFYQKIGNFFIGIAPILVGTFFLIFLMWIFLPSEFDIIKSTFNKNMVYIDNMRSIVDSFNIYISLVLSVLSSLNPFVSHNPIRYIIYIYIMYSITTHMDLSREDLETSKFGALLTVISVFIVCMILTIVGVNISVLIMKIYVPLTSFLTIGIVFSLISMLISKIILFIKRLIIN